MPTISIEGAVEVAYCPKCKFYTTKSDYVWHGIDVELLNGKEKLHPPNSFESYAEEYGPKYVERYKRLFGRRVLHLGQLHACGFKQNRVHLAFAIGDVKGQYWDAMLLEHLLFYGWRKPKFEKLLRLAKLKSYNPSAEIVCDSLDLKLCRYILGPPLPALPFAFNYIEAKEIKEMMAKGFASDPPFHCLCEDESTSYVGALQDYLDERISRLRAMALEHLIAELKELGCEVKEQSDKILIKRKSHSAEIAKSSEVSPNKLAWLLKTLNFRRRGIFYGRR